MQEWCDFMKDFAATSLKEEDLSTTGQDWCRSSAQVGQDITTTYPGQGLLLHQSSQILNMFKIDTTNED